MDITKRVRSTLNVDMTIMLHKNLQRRLELETFKILDEEYQLLEERRVRIFFTKLCKFHLET